LNLTTIKQTYFKSFLAIIKQTYFVL
jgi:hypothetical protein